MPDVFYSMDFDDFMALRRGWGNKLVYEQQVVKKQTMLILSGLIGGKNVNPAQLWWLPGDAATAQGKKMVEYKGVTMTEGQKRKLERFKTK